MKKTTLILLLLFMSLSACGQKNNASDESNPYEKEHEGFIASIGEKDHEGENTDEEKFKYRMLVISNADMDDVSGKTDDELIALVQDNGGAKYDINEDMYDEDKIELNRGVKVKIYWNGDEGESDPPVRRAEKIRVIPN